MNRKGILVVISGFSGVGKGTLVRHLMARYKDQYALSISATTRNPREGEIDGREYFFRKKEEFEALIETERLLEYACYCGNYYGTPKDYVEEQMAQGRDVILEIELQGALKIKERYPDTFLVYVMPPDAKTLVERLTERGTETEEVIKERLRRAVEESKEVDKYEYMLINDELDQSVEHLHSLIEVQHNKINRNLEFISQIQKDLTEYLKGEQ